MAATDAVVCVRDDSSSSSEVEVLRANLRDERAACVWVEQYGLRTNTSWIVDSVKSTKQCQRMVLHKTWCCKQHRRNKSPAKPRVDCPAKIDIKIKTINRHTRRTDPLFLRRDIPLPAVIKLRHHKEHSHSTESADALRRLTPLSETKRTFFGYFNDGMSPAKAIKLHESKLLARKEGLALLANAAVNPLPSAVYYWQKLWREGYCGRDVEPLEKPAEKVPVDVQPESAIPQERVQPTAEPPAAAVTFAAPCGNPLQGGASNQESPPVSKRPRALSTEQPHVLQPCKGNGCPTSEEETSHPTEAIEDDRFSCCFCGHTSRGHHAIVSHILAHSGERLPILAPAARRPPFEKVGAKRTRRNSQRWNNRCVQKSSSQKTNSAVAHGCTLEKSRTSAAFVPGH
ncbi:hypothetical protein IscW_ISCW011724 [Ixodes scapularis]|uniref:C2H2-type domain-containing protein n=1 Tax=Ixodes scapularis TaxID=6945 RepID=B7Q6N7_IXOSC|nr:hypothetical protein IscW_ISCW011724 [Ixodes scapularis]|eukprot:XP_002412005.1 hypothetical protein IscW_ISCW011724 [Ixodes scapularis]